MSYKNKEDRAAYYAKNRERIAKRSAAYSVAHKEEIAAYYASHKEEKTAYYAKNRKEIRARHKIYDAKNKEKIRAQQATYSLIRNYGLTLEEKQAMIETQEGKCRICKEEKPLHVDHCHNTGKIRGLLCGICNRALGGFKDSEELLISAIGYLRSASLLEPKQPKKE